MKNYWKWIISLFIVAVCTLFTIVAFNDSLTSGLILVGVDVVVLIGGIIYYLKYGKK